MSPTPEDTEIWFRLMKKHKYPFLYPTWETAAQRSEWVDFNLMRTIEQGKRDELAARRRMQVTGR